MSQPGRPWWDQRVASAVSSSQTRSSVRLEIIGVSTGGRSLSAVWLGKGAEGGRRVSTVAVVAGLDARHAVGTRVAVGLVEKLIAEPPPELAEQGLVIVTCANPDGLSLFETAPVKSDEGGNAAYGKTARDDADRDRRIDEDGPADLNGDGLITQMRVRQPRAGLARGLAAEHVSEPDDPRLLRSADRGKGERPEWAILVEGKDQDGDGLIAEDGPRGVDLDSNFPYHWPEFQDAAGATPLSEPESRAIAEWLLEHPEIVTVLVYAPNDNLINLPAHGKMDQTGQIPVSNGVLDEDKPLYERVSGRFKEITRITGVGGVTRSFDGSLQGWAYAHLGLASFVTPVWVRPDLVKTEDKPKDKDNDKPEGEAAPPAKKIVDTDDGKWLALSDQRVAAGLPPGFIEWSPFTHPQLGEVEIGGWVPGFRFNPTEPEIPGLVDQQAGFIGSLLAMLPKLEVEGPHVERLGEQTWRIRVEAVNTGAMPTRLAMGVRAKRHPPTRWRIDREGAQLLSGSRVQGRDSVEGAGGRLVGEWVVAGRAGEELKLSLLSPECGDKDLVVRLEVPGGERR